MKNYLFRLDLLGKKFSLEKSLVLFLFFLYSTIGTPIPPSIGVVELAIGLILVILVLILGLPRGRGRYYGIAFFSAFWLLVIPSMVGLGIEEVYLKDYVRDIFPLFFLFVPLFLQKSIDKDPEGWCNVFITSFVFSGLFLSIRYILRGGDALFDEVFIEDGAPINQCSTVIFAAIYGLSASILSGRNVIIRFFLFGVGAICFSTLMMGVMRAQIAIVVIGVLCGIVFSKSARSLIFIVAIVLSSYFASNFIEIPFIDRAIWTIEMVQKKTESVGLANARDAELETIVKHARASFGNLMLGSGWGASMYIPTAGRDVRFTHNGGLFFLWKTGIMGLIFCLLYIYHVIGGWKTVSKIPVSFFGRRNEIIIATLSALFVFGVIEMGYKMVSYGFMLCLLKASLMGVDNKKI